ncbi:MAG: hypothetical protein JRE72_01715, partial [Deltaproteobacteria bacterium]|nr:hypothetical protein [Deltaproteobacteria bacterium]
MDIRIRKFYLSVLVTAVFVLAYSIGMAEDNVVLDELLTEVQKTLIRVNNSIEKDQLPPLNKITL